MKLTKTKLKQIIKEEFEGTLKESSREAVEDTIYKLIDELNALGESDPELTDAYVGLMRALRSAGVRIEALVRMAE